MPIFTYAQGFMGVEIEKSQFTEEDFQEFDKRLKDETQLLKSHFENKRFLNSEQRVIGLELEAWLVDQNYNPTPRNKEVLDNIKEASLVPELSQFNVEYVTDPYKIQPGTLQSVFQEIKTMWNELTTSARDQDCFPLAVGILPTLRPEDMDLKNMSQQNRYYALNEELLNMRGRSPFRVDIKGKEHFQYDFFNLMIESITTSVQIHFQVNLENSARFYNAALLTCPSLVALAANSPFVMGKDVWSESRIPVFEQIINTCPHPDIKLPERVTLGPGYIQNSLFECFDYNVKTFKPLLPITFESQPEELKHLMLHNGTTWRWVRPLIGIDSKNDIHLRIEQRVPSAGPTALDIVANTAFYLGLLYELATQDTPPETLLDYSDLRQSFYAACEQDLDAKVKWIDQKTWTLQTLILEKLLPTAEIGLKKMNFDPTHITSFLKIIEERTKSKQTGAAWQRQFINKHGKDFQKLVKAYFENQDQGNAVHTWGF